MVMEDRLPPIPLDRPVSTGAPIERTLALARKLEVDEVVIGLDHKVLHPLGGSVYALERAHDSPFGELEKVCFHKIKDFKG